MFNVIGDLDWLAVVLATVAAAALAGVYFAVLVPGPYAVALGREGAPAPESDLVTQLGPVVCLLVTTLTSAVLVEALDVTGTGDAVVFGLVVGLGFLTAMAFQVAINPNVPRPLLYGLVNAPFFVVSSVVVALILVAMR